MSSFLATLVIAVSVTTLGFYINSPWGESQQSHTQTAFKQWAQQCKPDDFHYGVTEDEHGTRAFIVTCSPVGLTQ